MLPLPCGQLNIAGIATVLKRNMSLRNQPLADRSALDARMAAAHGRLETKFLDGGAVLVAISDILKRLIGSLDRLTTALDHKTTEDTIARIRATAADLAALPGFEVARQKGFCDLAVICKTMIDDVTDMRETMRYLRTFAITVKITGAGLVEFDGFADEIRDRIQSGADEVSRFGAQLATMQEQLIGARTFSANISKNYGNIVPDIVRDLEHNAGKVAEHHQHLARIAEEVKSLARGIQGKIATVLSALQIGDITRQRIEHIRSSFELFEEFRLSPEGQALDAESISRIDDAISQLAAAQMEETVFDFQRDCRKIMETMSRFVDDTRDILTLRDDMQQQGGSGNFLSDLADNVAAASKLVGTVHETSQQADGVARSTSSTARTLLQAIEVIRSIKTDIHYMALNSNLRCSRLGDEGRAVNVVSGELRFFAEKLDAPAEAVLSKLHNFDVAAGAISVDGDSGATDISLPLNAALDVIAGVSGRMDESIAEFEREGQEVFSKVSAAIATLDFESELGDVLGDCVKAADAIAVGCDGDIGDLADHVGDLSARIYKIYTMAPERDIHLRFLPMSATAVAPVAAVITSDEDLFEDALF
jgi:methyl-accepting chemotaxis protein